MVPSLYEQQLERLKSLQDEQYLCLNSLQQYQQQLQASSDEVSITVALQLFHLSLRSAAK